MVDRTPGANDKLAMTMFGAGRSTEAVKEVLAQAEAQIPERRRPREHLFNGVRLAIAAGDFTRGRELAHEVMKLVDADPQSDFRDHLFPTMHLIGTARETGDEAEAFRVALGFVKRSETWSRSDGGSYGVDDSMWVVRQTVRPGGLSQAEFESRRDVWVDARRKLSGAHPAVIWIYAYAATAETPDEARKAIGVLPEYAPLSSFPLLSGGDIPDAEIGNAFLLAGRVDEAAHYLSRAVANCGAFSMLFAHTRAALQLGQALEQKGDTPGACAAYQKVRDRWGNAKPRSISAEKATARMKALACRS
jgi:tetratricopeptide (TPR) repeat protein